MFQEAATFGIDMEKLLETGKAVSLALEKDRTYLAQLQEKRLKHQPTEIVITPTRETSVVSVSLSLCSRALLVGRLSDD